MESKRKDWLKKIDYKKKSGIFLFPMLHTSLYHKDKAYLIDISLVQMGFPQIVLSFDNIDDNLLKEDIHRLSLLSEYVDSEYGDNDKEVNMFFDVPKIYKNDFELFVQGFYSQFSEKYKNLLVKNYGDVKESGKTSNGLPKVSLYDAIYPDKKLKMAFGSELAVDWKLINEVLDPPNIELEEFKLVEDMNNGE